MVTKPPTQQSFIPAVAAAVASLLAVLFFIWGISGQMSVVRSQKSELAGLTNDLFRLDQILLDEKSYASIIQKLAQTLPKEYSDLATAVSAIELTAKTNRLQTDLAIDEKPKAQQGNINSLTIAVKTSGSYTDISQFAADISQLPYHTHIDTLAFENAGGKVTATITIRLFMQ